jgi:hypothetical protein
MATQGLSNDKGFISSGESISYWIDSVKPIEFTSLEKPLDTDVLIIGGGIAGLSTAYSLLQKGRKMEERLRSLRMAISEAVSPVALLHT